jgi:hypothetical protein
VTTRNVISVCLAVLFGFVLGAMLSHPKTVKAQSGVRVYITDDSSPGLGSTSVPSAQVVGFSCVEEHIGSVENPRCYIAYVK